jgi:hypothetical protein
MAPRVYVEPSPAGGYHVKLAGADAPISHHDTEEEAHARAAAYLRGLVSQAAPPAPPAPPSAS